MSIQKHLRRTLLVVVASASAIGTSVDLTQAAERPTLNHHTRDPRPDILVHPLYDRHVEYRRAYNRPRFVGGWVAHTIAPSSQEAMIWCENVRKGRYDEHHAPPLCKKFYYPKPWEILQTGARPDTKRAEDVQLMPATDAMRPDAVPSEPVPEVPVPAPTEDASPSDN